MRPLLLVSLVALAALSACGKRTEEANTTAAARTAPAAAVEPRKIDRSHAGQPAPTTAFRGADGKSLTIAGFRGKPVLLNLWATWCGPCVKEMPSLDRISAARAGKLQVLALSQDSGLDKIDAFFAKAGIRNLGRYLDADNAVMGAVKVEMLPTTILFDAQGREVWRVAADRDWQSAETGRLLDEALS